MDKSDKNWRTLVNVEKMVKILASKIESYAEDNKCNTDLNMFVERSLPVMIHF